MSVLIILLISPILNAADVAKPNPLNDDKFVYFCIGHTRTCVEVEKEKILKFPNSKLAKWVSGNPEPEIASKAESVFDNDSDEIKIKKRKEIIIRDVDLISFLAITRWITLGSTTLINDSIRATVLEDAKFLELESLIFELEGCPAGYVRIGGNPLYHTPQPGNDFCVMKYAASNKNGRSVSDENLLPWVNISFEEAKKACANLGQGHHLITSDEWLAIARKIEMNPGNWHWHATVIKKLSQGNSTESVALAPKDPKIFSGSYSRKFYLASTEQDIYDMAGNVWQWVQESMEIRLPAASTWLEFVHTEQDPDDNSLPRKYKPLQGYNSIHNAGMYFDSQQNNPHVSIRGGSFHKGYNKSNINGIYAAVYNEDPNKKRDNRGFRCAYTIPKN